MNDFLHAFIGQATGHGGLESQMNNDEFLKMAKARAQPQSCMSGVVKEADRLRSLAHDINALKKAGLI